MKKTMSLLLSGALLFALWGCGAGTSGTTSSSGSGSSSGGSSSSSSGSTSNTGTTNTGHTTAWVSFTFDDGDFSVDQKQAFDKMISCSILGTLYIVPSWVGDGDGHFEWSDIVYYMSFGWEVGNHTETHPHPLDITTAAFTSEVYLAEKALQQNLGIKASAFAIPYGEGYALNSVGQVVLNSDLLAALNGLGYIKTSRQAVSGDNTTDLNDPKTFDPMAIKVFSWKGTTAESYITGLVDQAIAKNQWLVLVIHVVATNPDPTDDDQISLKALNDVCDYIHARADKIKSVTISQGVAAMKQ